MKGGKEEGASSDSVPAVNLPRPVVLFQIQLITPNGTYVRAGPPNPSVASSAFPTMDTTTDGSDLRTYLTPLPCPGRPHAVFFVCYDNLYISSNGEWLGRWAYRGSDWEAFDILETAQVAAVRGPNLGSWLAFENWMVPGLYPNPRPWNDGTAVRKGRGQSGVPGFGQVGVLGSSVQFKAVLM